MKKQGLPPLHFLERGADDGSGRPALVLLHYFGGSSRSWEPVIQIMAARGFRCIAPDFRGFGKSPGTSADSTSYRVDAMADDVAALVRYLDLKAFALIGHSMGGKAALALASRQPDGLRAVVLIAPSPPTPEPMGEEERARLLTGYGDASSAKETLRKITANALARLLFDIAIGDQLRASKHAWRAWLLHGSREDTSARLNTIRTPIAVAVGAADETITEVLVRREIVDRLAAAATVRVIPDAGHLLPLEAPRPTASLITDSVCSEGDR